MAVIRLPIETAFVPSRGVAEGYPPLPPLPPRVVTPDGQEVDLTDDVWRVRQRVEGGVVMAIRTDRLRESGLLSARAVDQVKLFLVRKLMTTKAETVKNQFEAFLHFVRWLRDRHPDASLMGWEAVSEVSFRAYLEDLKRTPDGGNHFTRVRDFYRWGAFVQEFPEFAKDLALLLKTIRAPGNRKGEAVRGWDPEKGPLDSDETSAILAALREHAGTEEQRAIVRLFLELGVRPLVVPILRNAHLRRYTANLVLSDGTSGERVDYQLRVPRLKGRGGKIKGWKVRPISRLLGEWLWTHRVGGPGDPLYSWIRKDSPREHIGSLLRDWAEAADLVSPRTRVRLRLTSRRFRYTLATQMAIEGASREQIAEMLDHTDLQNVEVYIDAAAAFMNDLEVPLADILDPLVRRFLGKVVERDDPAPFPGIPRQVIPGSAPQLPSLPVLIGSVGVCGRDIRRDGLCRLAPPLSCYLCPSFAAFRDAPHERIADSLEKLVYFRANTSADERIPNQLEGTLKAIRQLQAQLATEAEVVA